MLRVFVMVVAAVASVSAIDLSEFDLSFVPPDMKMLYQASTPPPPSCPPHCITPIPEYADVNCTFQLMKMLPLPGAGRLKDYERTGSYLCAPRAATAAAHSGPGKGKLLLFFTGTAPSDNTLFIQTAATLGFHAIALSYNNEGAPNGQCSDYPRNQTIINDHWCVCVL